MAGDLGIRLGRDGRARTQPHLTFSHPHSGSPSLLTQEVDAAEIQVQVCLYAFDLIYLNGEVSSSIVSWVVGG